MIVAALAGNLLVHQPAHDLEIHHPDLRLQQRGLHPLALARHFALKQRDQRADRAEQTRGEVGNRDTRAHRSATGLARHRHDAAQALRDLVQAGPVFIGTILTESGHARQDDARVDLAKGFVINAQLELDVRAIVLDDDIRLPDHFHKGGATLRMLQVKRDAALVAMRILVIGKLRGATRLVIRLVIGLLDLDDIRAPVGKLPDSSGTRAHAGQVQDSEARKRKLRHAVSP